MHSFLQSTKPLWDISQAADKPVYLASDFSAGCEDTDDTRCDREWITHDAKRSEETNKVNKARKYLGTPNKRGAKFEPMYSMYGDRGIYESLIISIRNVLTLTEAVDRGAVEAQAGQIRRSSHARHALCF
jgi:hypothetical protein